MACHQPLNTFTLSLTQSNLLRGLNSLSSGRLGGHCNNPYPCQPSMTDSQHCEADVTTINPRSIMVGDRQFYLTTEPIFTRRATMVNESQTSLRRLKQPPAKCSMHPYQDLKKKHSTINNYFQHSKPYFIIILV